MRGLSLSRAWDETKAIIARDGRLLVSVALALIVLPQTVVGVLVPTIGTGSSNFAKSLIVIVILIGFIAQIALNRLAIGPSTTVGAAIARGLSRLLFLLGAVILVGMAILILLVILAVLFSALGLMAAPGTGHAPSPGILALFVVCTLLIAAILQLCVPVAAAEQGGPLRLLSRSWQLGRHEYLRLLGFVVVVFFGIIFIALATQFVVGSVILLLAGPPNAGSLSALLLALAVASAQAAFSIVAAVMLARMYVQLAGRGGSGASVPTTGI